MGTRAEGWKDDTESKSWKEGIKLIGDSQKRVVGRMPAIFMSLDAASLNVASFGPLVKELQPNLRFLTGVGCNCVRGRWKNG